MLKTGHQRLSGYVKMGMKKTTYSSSSTRGADFHPQSQPEVLMIVNHKNWH
jgi:hypothetical protein